MEANIQNIKNPEANDKLKGIEFSRMQLEFKLEHWKL